MTRVAQKQSERRTLDAILAALGLCLDHEPEAGEAPDFTMRVERRLIGVEITLYRSGAMVDDGTERRPVENEWERLKVAADAFRSQRRELRDINVGLMFNGAVPPRRQHIAFMEEIASFARSRAPDLTARDLECWPPSFPTPLMQTYLRTLYLRKGPFAEWYSNLADGYVARPDRTIAEIVAEKSAKRYRPVEELWLAIQCGTRISEMMLDIMGVEDFAAVPSLEWSAFSRVFVLAYTGAYEWRKAAGWRKLTGTSLTGQGASFDELKNVLSDPEWLDDPDGKAVQVAMECLREIREGRGKS
jgi:hypothetical protein